MRKYLQGVVKEDGIEVVNILAASNSGVVVGAGARPGIGRLQRTDTRRLFWRRLALRGREDDAGWRLPVLRM